MIPPVATEDIPLVIDLKSYDRENDEVEYTIVRTIFEAMAENGNAAGALYQYEPGFNPNNYVLSALTKIEDGDKVTNVDNRVIFIGPKYGNSYADPTTNGELLVIPCFSYKVTEKDADHFDSNVLEVQILINAVNNKPWAWGQEGSYKTFPEVDANICWSNGAACTFEEDFGHEFPWEVDYRFISLGGSDVEESKLDFKLTQVDCYPGTEITMPLVIDTNLKANDVIKSQEPNSLIPLIRFKPTANAHSGSWEKGYYCQIKYVAVDSEGLESAENTITVDITAVNKPPRLGAADTTVVAREGVPKLFTLDAVDPEGTDFTGYLTACAANRGKYELCLDADCVERQPISCNPADLPLAFKPQTSTGKVAPEGYTVFFTSDSIESLAEGSTYNQWTMEFRDGTENSFGWHPFFINFRVVSLNDAPVITINGEVSDVHTDLPQTPGLPWSNVINAVDSDLANGNMIVTLNLEVPADADGARIVMPSVLPVEVEATEIAVKFMARQEDVTAILAGITIAAPIDQTKGRSVTLTITANDMGNSGQCPHDQGDIINPQSFCELTATTQVNIVWTAAEDNSMVTVAASASAAGFAGLAAIAAIAAFRKFNEKAAEGYEPWQEEAGDGVIDNPLYQTNGNSGSNALYSGK
jgi:hypothetical protein